MLGSSIDSNDSDDYTEAGADTGGDIDSDAKITVVVVDNKRQSTI